MVGEGRTQMMVKIIKMMVMVMMLIPVMVAMRIVIMTLQ